MNKREIILDFTSLLDVIMIILFFFILFSHFETIEQKEIMESEYNQIIEEAEQLKADAEKLMTEAEEKNKQAEDILSEAQQADKRNAYNIAGIMEFSRGLNLRLDLNMNSGSGTWELNIFCGDEFIESIQNTDSYLMAEQFTEIISGKGYTYDDTILCIFTYNANESGTRSAYMAVNEIFEIVKSEYTHFFCSETDISIEKE